MAQRVTVTLEDDLDGGPADETIRFAFGGAEYEIDLGTKNATAFRKRLVPFIEHARKAGRAQPRRPGRAAGSRQRSGDIRPGRKTTASRSVSAGVSRPAWWSSTTPPPKAADPSRSAGRYRTVCSAPACSAAKLTFLPDGLSWPESWRRTPRSDVVGEAIVATSVSTRGAGLRVPFDRADRARWPVIDGLAAPRPPAAAGARRIARRRALGRRRAAHRRVPGLCRRS